MERNLSAAILNEKSITPKIIWKMCYHCETGWGMSSCESSTLFETRFSPSILEYQTPCARSAIVQRNIIAFDLIPRFKMPQIHECRYHRMPATET